MAFARMSTHAVRALASVVLFLASGCSDHGPASPTPQPVASLTVSLGLSSVFTGHTTTATATAKKADGSTEVVSAAWTSDKPGVATVSATGLVTAVGSGTATIVASYQGLTGSATLGVTPDFSGTWTGTAQVESCEGFTDFRTCSKLAPAGTVANLRLTLVQDGNGVRGSLELQTQPPTVGIAQPHLFSGAVTGTFDDSGLLALGGATSEMGSPHGEIREWRSRIASSLQEGTFSHVFPPTDPFWDPYQGTVRWTALTLRR